MGEATHLDCAAERSSNVPCHVQNPDLPNEKPTLQSYKLDLSQCGPMVLDALVSSQSFSKAG